MATSGPQVQILAYILACGAMLALFAHGYARGRGLGGAAVVTVMAASLFLAFKEGFVRHDFFHTPVALETLCLIALIMVCAVRTRHAAAITVCALALLPALYVGNVATFEAAFLRIPAHLADQVRGTIRLAFGNNAIDANYRQALAAIRQSQQLPNVVGTADIYSWDQTALLASGMQWNPRPIFQS
jgi:hypothetical protein